MADVSLAASIRTACTRWGSRPALTHGGRTIGYAELWEGITRLARAYQELGIGAGDRVVCQLPVCPEHLIAAHAAWACGAIHVGADHDLTGSELAALVARTRASAVVVDAADGTTDPRAALRAARTAHPPVVAITRGGGRRPGVHRLSDLLAGPPCDPPWPEGPTGPALLLLTSGSTGTPKAVVETMAGLRAKMRFYQEVLSCGPDDVHLMHLPIAHAFGLELTLLALATGGRVVLDERFSPDRALRLADEEGVTILPGTPAHLVLLLRAADRERRRPGSLRWAVSAAAPLPRGLSDEVAKRFGAPLLYVYGCSEGFLMRTADPDDLRAGSVGTTVLRGPTGTRPNGAVRVVDLEQRVPLPPGEVGEVEFGAAIPVRYWDTPPAATDGWYRTGDLGHRDGRGRLFLVGRLKELVNRGGLKVAAREVERELECHPDVADCAVVPTPDPVLGEAICACVVPAGRAPTLAQVRDLLRQRLARHKLPDELCLLDAIPRTDIGKVDRAALTARVVDAGAPRERLRG